MGIHSSARSVLLPRASLEPAGSGPDRIILTLHRLTLARRRSTGQMPKPPSRTPGSTSTTSPTSASEAASPRCRSSRQPSWQAWGTKTSTRSYILSRRTPSPTWSRSSRRGSRTGTRTAGLWREPLSWWHPSRSSSRVSLQLNRQLLPCYCQADIVILCREAALPGEAFKARYALLCISTSGVFGGLPSLCAWVGDNSRTTTAGALATALNVAFSGPGQIIGVWIYRSQDAPVYRLGHGVNAGLAFLSAVLSFGLAFYYRKLNARMAGTTEMRWIQ